MGVFDERGTPVHMPKYPVQICVISSHAGVALVSLTQPSRGICSVSVNLTKTGSSVTHGGLIFWFHSHNLGTLAGHFPPKPLLNIPLKLNSSYLSPIRGSLGRGIARSKPTPSKKSTWAPFPPNPARIHPRDQTRPASATRVCTALHAGGAAVHTRDFTNARL